MSTTTTTTTTRSTVKVGDTSTRTSPRGETITSRVRTVTRYVGGFGSEVGPVVVEVVTSDHLSNRRPFIRPTYRVWVDGVARFGGPADHLDAVTGLPDSTVLRVVPLAPAPTARLVEVTVDVEALEAGDEVGGDLYVDQVLTGRRFVCVTGWVGGVLTERKFRTGRVVTVRRAVSTVPPVAVDHGPTAGERATLAWDAACDDRPEGFGPGYPDGYRHAAGCRCSDCRY